LAINGNNLDRVFVVGQIYTRNLAQNVAINGLTISGGNQTYGGGLLNFATLSMINCIMSNNAGGTSGGGGIYNVGALTIQGCGFTNNSVGQSSAGGAIDNNASGSLTAYVCTFNNNSANGTGLNESSGGAVSTSGTMILSGCTFTGNTAASDAGAVYNDGNLTLARCTFINNSCGADGGALHFTGTVVMDGCTLSGNYAGSSAGGLEESVGTSLTMTNCTFVNNTGNGTAGGMVNFGPGVTLTNVTFTGNRAINSGSGGHYGGGLWSYTACTLQNCIIAGNFAGSGTTPNDIDTNVNAASSYNLIGTGGSGGLVNGVNHNMVGVANPMLGALASNGGPTQTVALLPGSPAIDHGNNAVLTAGETDQRGFNRVVNGTVDIGAFEGQMSITAPASQSASQGVAASINLGAFTDANASAGPWSVSLNWGDGSAPTTFSTSGTGAVPAQTHTFTQSGVLTATVVVTDANHEFGQATFSVTVSASATASLAVSGYPTLTTTGTAGTLTVTAIDNTGHVATSYRGTVHFSSSDAAAVLPVNYAYTATDNGVHVFTATLKTLGSQSITAADTVTTTIKGSQIGIQVNSTAAPVLTVNSTADNTTADSVLTLREAIMLANGSLGRPLTAGEQSQLAGTLGSAAATIQFSLPAGPQTITLAGGALNVTQSMTINGPGAGSLTVNGNNLDRVFVIGQIWSPNTSQVVTLGGMTISGGNQVYGGGVLNFGSLTINSCVISGNTSGGSGGGGIYNVASLTLKNSTVSGNTTSQLGTGGGLENISSGTATVTACTFSGNTATGTGSSASSGAGAGNSGTMQLTGCTFSSNTAASNGGGVFNAGSLSVATCTFVNNSCGADGGGIDQDGTATITGSTFSGNFANSEGGALASKGTLTMSNCTVYGNSATSDGGGINSTASLQAVNCTITANRVTVGTGGTFGGGIYAQSVAPKIFNTIVAGNFQGAAPGTTANDIAGNADATSAFNLIGTGGSGGLTDGVNGNQVGVSNPGLGMLANNGGATQTVALLPGSTAVNRGSNTYVQAGTLDQRGLTRIVGGTVDIGAFEVQTVLTAPANQTGTHGVAGTFSLGSFSDPSNAIPWTVTVNWGDGTSATTVSTSTQGSLGTRSHTYAASGSYKVIVTLSDANNDISQVTFTIVVS
jgi:predicted outer membrane repeat protein